MRGFVRAHSFGAVLGLLVGFGASFKEAGAAELSKSEEARVWKQGEISAMAEACGLDWQALSFQPMMAYWRRLGKSQKELALIAGYHGAAQGYTGKAGPCTDEMRRKLETQLPFKG
ncbi:hypothetical protein NS226_21450 [Aureimonas ureilytica]|uniref:Uncharacterized protein n=1 Tax=Aureimonas ureilytica TaxID=401562 RepID=A0A175R2C5_9HYPH|nr:hypothetical protein [Aureimonas ureilytica]KTQ84640.1 hypothetical protein NS226_21450 [Aureimonas ureilytica]